jgi:hypothetical protein
MNNPSHELRKRLALSPGYQTGDSLRTISFRSAHSQRASRRGLLFRGHDGVRRFKGGILEVDTWSTRKSETDLLRIPPAIALQGSLISELEQRGCLRLVVVVVPRIGHPETRYSVLLADFVRLAFTVNRGHGPQLALRLERWDKQELA